MNQIYSPAILALLTSWAERPDAATDLHETFGINHRQATDFLEQIKSADFSWLPKAEIVSSSILTPAIAAYARETATIYLSDNCPPEFINEAILEEIGHHIDALFNEEETPGDEGALFSATVRGVSLSDEEIESILKEDDSATLTFNGTRTLVECIIVRKATLPAYTPPAPNTDSLSAGTDASTTLGATQHYLISNTGPTDTAQSLFGNTPATPLAFNYLKAGASNAMLIAGNALVTTIQGGAGYNSMFGGSGAQTDYFIGGSSRY